MLMFRRPFGKFIQQALSKHVRIQEVTNYGTLLSNKDKRRCNIIRKLRFNDEYSDICPDPEVHSTQRHFRQVNTIMEDQQVGVWQQLRGRFCGIVVADP